VALENAPVQLYGEPEYDYLYSIVNGEQVLRPTWTDNPIAVDPEDAGRIAMTEDPVIDHILDERAADLASGPRAEEGVQDWFATRLSTHQPSFGPRDPSTRGILRYSRECVEKLFGK
jgi:hypothetical protein